MGFFKKLFSFANEIEDEDVVVAPGDGAVDTDAMWADVVSKLDVVQSRITCPKGRPYMSIASKTHKKNIVYWAGYSPRGEFAWVCIETYGGEAARDAIMAIVERAPKGHICAKAEMKQGARNKDKWALTVTTSIDKPTSELVEWYADNLLAFYKFFEAATPFMVEEVAAADAEKRAAEEAAKAAEKAKAAAEAVKAAEEAKARAAAETAAAKAEAERMRAELEAANKAKAEAEAARAEIERIKAEAEAMRLAAEKAKAEAEKAAAETAKAATSAATSVGLFTINSEGDKICFSRGLLQFNPAKYEFRFAENQYDIIGEDNEKIAPNYDGWIDLFGWGTSGFMGCQPTEVSIKDTDYGPASGDIAGTNYDWGVYNPITNGGNKEGLWRTPTKDEWEYLTFKRPNAAKLLVKCRICGVEGYMLMPDNFWDNRLHFPLDMTADNCSVNTYSAKQWSQLESLGVVFMPSVGSREGRRYYSGCRGIWLATNARGGSAYHGRERDLIYHFDYDSHHHCGLGVRLIKDVAKGKK